MIHISTPYNAGASSMHGIVRIIMQVSEKQDYATGGVGVYNIGRERGRANSIGRCVEIAGLVAKLSPAYRRSRPDTLWMM